MGYWDYIKVRTHSINKWEGRTLLSLNLWQRDELLPWLDLGSYGVLFATVVQSQRLILLNDIEIFNLCFLRRDRNLEYRNRLGSRVETYLNLVFTPQCKYSAIVSLLKARGPDRERGKSWYRQL